MVPSLRKSTRIASREAVQEEEVMVSNAAPLSKGNSGRGAAGSKVTKNIKDHTKKGANKEAKTKGSKKVTKKKTKNMKNLTKNRSKITNVAGPVKRTSSGWVDAVSAETPGPKDDEIKARAERFVRRRKEANRRAVSDES